MLKKYFQVQSVQFTPLSSDPSQNTSSSSINRVEDIPITLTVEMGRTNMLIRDILDLKPGSIIELDRIAGEPLDILANEKKIAKGEVVVVEGLFGIRVTEILRNTIQKES